MKTILKRILIILGFLWAGGALAAETLTFFVDPDGSDAADGLSVSAPFQTLEKARDAVREKLAAGETGDITIQIRGGRYVLTEPVVFGLEDGAQKEGQRIVYEAFPGETPVFTSLLPIDSWRLAEELPEYVPAEAKGSVFKADISDIASARKKAVAEGGTALWDWRVKILYQNGSQIPPAKGEAFDPEVMHKAPAELGGGRDNLLAYPKGVFKTYQDVKDAELKIIPRFDWSMNILPVESVDEENRICRTTVPGTYALETTWKWKLRPCAWFENVPWGLRPGRWLFNSREEALYYWSVDGKLPAGTGISGGLLEYIRVEGKIDYAGPEDTPVKGLVFRGLTFTEGARYTFPSDYKGGRWQHDWAGFDVSDALLRFRGAEDCLVEKCRFVNSGATGIRLDLHAQNIIIRENEFAHLGEGGVVISGYGPGTKDVNHDNTVVNNWFHHGAEHHWHANAIFIAQSGNNTIRHNLIHDYSYSGIAVSGLRRLVPNANMRSQKSESQKTVRWHEIEKKAYMDFPDTLPYMHAVDNQIEENEIFRIMERLGDGCAIYLSCAGKGNVVQSNYIHRIRGDAASALRSDDSQWDARYFRNIIYRCTGHGIILKGPNQAVNNFLVDQQDHFVEQNMKEAVGIAIRTGPAEDIVVQRNIFAQVEAGDPVAYYIKPTSHLKKYGNLTLESVRAAQVDSNLFWWAERPAVAENLLDDIRKTFGFDRHSRVADPLFADPESGDFSFQSDIPEELGIEPIDISGAGLTGAFRENVYKPSAGKVTIEPQGERIFTGPVEISMEVDSADAQIRYTLDGTEPNDDSAVYEEPFVLTRPATIRARAFQEGAVDRLGARVRFIESTQPVFESFENVADGASRSRIKLGGVNAKSTIALEQNPDPEQQDRVLCFSKGTSGSPYQPKGYYQVTLGEPAEVSFDLWLEEGAAFALQWMDDPGAPFYRLRGIEVQEDGTVVSLKDKTVLGSVQPDSWNHFILKIPAGDDPKISPQLWVNGKELDLFARTPSAQALRFIRQFNFCAAAKKPSVLYLDNIRISRIDR